MKKNIYDILNEVEIDTEGYEAYELSEIEKERIKKSMKKNRISIKKVLPAAACAAVCVALLSQTAFAKNLVSQFVQSVKLDHVQVEQMQGQPKNIDDEKNIVSEKTEDGVTEILYEDGTMVMVSGADGRTGDSKKAIITDAESINENTAFLAKLPAYLPEGYQFDRAEQYKDSDGSISGKYLTVYFNNAAGQEVFLQERLADEETGFADGTDGTLEEIMINGNRAALSDGHNLTWEADGTIYTLSAKDIPTQELIQIAESI